MDTARALRARFYTFRIMYASPYIGIYLYISMVSKALRLLLSSRSHYDNHKCQAESSVTSECEYFLGDFWRNDGNYEILCIFSIEDQFLWCKPIILVV